MSSYVERNDFLCMRDILQGIELIEMLGAPIRTSTGRGPLERAKALDQEQMLPFGGNGP